MIDPIAKLHSPTGSLVSVYVNRRPQATRAVLVDLVKRLYRSNRSKDLRQDAERITGLAERIEADTAPAVAVFASQRDGVFEFLPLTDRVEDTSTVGPRPYLRPLRAQPRPMRAGVIVADTARARTFIMSGGALHEYGVELRADRGKDSFGGFGGYEEQHNRARAAEMSAHLWRQAGRRLLEAHQDQPLELIVMAGHDHDFDAVAAELHPFLRQLPQGRTVVHVGSLGLPALAEAVEREVRAERRRRSVAMVDRLLSELGRHGAAVTGLSGVLDACNAHAVQQLIVAGPFSKQGVLCDACGWLGRQGGQCRVCGSSLFAVDDVVACAMDATVEAGGKTDIVTVASPLDAAGVGALVRFRPG